MCRWFKWNTEYQRCIIQQIRNTLKYIPQKDKGVFVSDLKRIYHASNEHNVLIALEEITSKWESVYPKVMKSWKYNWDTISPIFKVSVVVRKDIYTTNTIKSLNSTYRKLNRQRNVFPNDIALLNALYLATLEATKKWNFTIRNYAQVNRGLYIMYDGRIPE